MYVGDRVLWLYRYLRGYLKISVKGEFSEKLLNLCAANRITLWNSRIIKGGIETCIFIKDFFALRYLIRGSKLRVHICEKAGVPIRTSKNRKRIGLFGGIILLFVFLKVMSGYIWVIDVSGNEKVKTEEVIKACQKIGIKEGIRADSINPKIQREQLLLELDSLAWASLNVEGSRLTVNISEIKEKGKEEDAPTNIKANADGIIKKINVTSGNCLVKVGDTVKKGDILVSGVIEASDGTRFVKSAGSIIATVTESIEEEGEYKKIYRYETGKCKEKAVLQIFTLKIPLFLGSETQKYNSDLRVSSAKLFGQNIPIRLYKKQFRFVKEEKITLSREELIEQLDNKIDKRLEAMAETEYEILSRTVIDTEKGLKISVLVKKEMEIARAETILVSSEN